MIKDLCKFLLIMLLVSFCFGIILAFLQYIAFFITALGWNAESTAGMWSGMLLLLTIKWIERKMF